VRLAVVQLEVQAGRRAVALQRALAALDAAADRDPAPDLILLPAFADVPAVLAGRPFIAERTPGQTASAIGYHGREWGVFTAFGFAESHADTLYMTAALLDRDGDLRLANRQMTILRGVTDRFTAGTAPRPAGILFGRVAVLAGDDLLNEQAWAAATVAGGQIVLGCACWTLSGDHDLGSPEVVRSRLAALAGRFGVPCAVSDVLTAEEESGLDCPGCSVVLDQQGVVVAAAEPRTAQTLWGEVVLAAAAPSEDASSESEVAGGP